MPYSATDELPDNIKNALPAPALKIWMEAFNQAFDDECSDKSDTDRETCAIRVAWGAVKQTYEQNDDGEWVKIQDEEEQSNTEHCHFCNTQIMTDRENSTHDVIIQGLDQSLPDPRFGEVYYPVETFKNSLDNWDGVPVVYIPSGVHIPPRQFLENPEQALKEYGASIVGEVTNPEVIEQGQRRLQAPMQINNQQIEEAINNGEIQLSTAFMSAGREQIQEPIIPSYVMLFHRNAANPNDKLTMFLNSNIKPESDTGSSIHINQTTNTNTKQNAQVNTKMAEDDLYKQNAELESKLRETENTLNQVQEEKTNIEQKLEEKDQLIEQKNTEISEKDQQINDLQNKLQEFQNAEAERQWQNIKDNYIPPGMIETENDEKTLREQYNTDKDTFWMKVAKANASRPAETDREGLTIAHKNTSNEDDGPTGLGNWNPDTGKFE